MLASNSPPPYIPAMLRTLSGRLISAILVLFCVGGGGGLPLLDGLLFHELSQTADSTGSHYESSAACHADGCAVRSTAQPARFAPSFGANGWVSSSPERQPLVPSFPACLVESLSGRPLSRAPPCFG